MKVQTISLYVRDLSKQRKLLDVAYRAPLLTFIEQNAAKIEPKNLVFCLSSIKQEDAPFNCTFDFSQFTPYIQPIIEKADLNLLYRMSYFAESMGSTFHQNFNLQSLKIQQKILTDMETNKWVLSLNDFRMICATNAQVKSNKDIYIITAQLLKKFVSQDKVTQTKQGYEQTIGSQLLSLLVSIAKIRNYYAKSSTEISSELMFLQTLLIPQLHTLNLQYLLRLLSAFHFRSIHSPKLLHEVLVRIQNLSNNFSKLNRLQLGLVLSISSKINCYYLTNAILDTLKSLAENQLLSSQFEPKSWLIILTALKEIGICDEKLTEHVVQTLLNFEFQDKSLLIDYIYVLLIEDQNQTLPNYLVPLIKKLLDEQSFSIHQLESKRQRKLYQILYLAKVLYGCDLYQEQRKSLENVIVAQQLEVRKDIDWEYSLFHQQINKMVSQLYPDAQNEVLIDSFYKVDIYLPLQKIVIEVNGPHHLNGKGLPSNKTLMKARILRKLDYKYASIEYHQFVTKTSDENKMEFVKNQISFGLRSIPTTEK